MTQELKLPSFVSGEVKNIDNCALHLYSRVYLNKINKPNKSRILFYNFCSRSFQKLRIGKCTFRNNYIIKISSVSWFYQFTIELIQWFSEEEEKSELHPVELAAQLHHKYILIYPFDDGNGRIARLLVNFVLMKNELPPIIIKSAEKKKYLQALRKADAGDMDSFIAYVAGELEWSLRLSLKAAKGESLKEPDDWEKELSTLVKKGEPLPDHRNEKITIQRFEDSILPLVKNLKAKVMGKVAIYFASFSDDFSSDKMNLEELIRTKKFMNTIPEKVGGSSRIKYRMVFEQFKNNGDNPFDIALTFNVKFHDYSYYININDIAKSGLTKKIEEPISKIEENQVIQYVGEFLTRLIKEKLG